MYECFLRLRARLAAAGLSDAAAKRPPPGHPRAIGVVTSLAGAALHDVATTLARRSPHVRVVVYPSVVQGSDAPAALCAAIAAAGARNEVDVLIVCRGGGSLEDLWAFNDERVVRAIRAAPMHVGSGVGHETNMTPADLAADLRAPTPTAAAELVAPATAPLQQALDRLELLLARRAAATLETQAQRLDRLALRLARPSESVGRRAHVLDLLAQRLATAPLRALAAGRARSDAAAGRARHVERVLGRGYALLIGADGKPITTVARLAVGSRVAARLADGAADLVTTAVSSRQAGH